MADIPSDWCVTTNADNATATATRAAPTGGICNYVTMIAGSFSAAPGTPKTLILKNGTTEIGRWYISTGGVGQSVVFNSPIRLSPGTAANLDLAASGTGGTIGAATMSGYTK